MQYTTKLNLKKPDSTDYVNVSDLNENMDIIDAEIKNLSEASGNLDELSTDEKNSLVLAVNELLNKIGTLSSLSTTEKGNLVASINEIKANLTEHLAEETTNAHLAKNIGIEDATSLFTATDVEGALKETLEKANQAFQQANDIKGKWANVVGSPLLATDTSTSLQSKTQTIKNTLATNLTNKGTSASGAETLTSLVNKVENVGLILKPGTTLLVESKINTPNPTMPGGTVYTKYKEIKIHTKGIVRVKFELRSTSYDNKVYGRVYVNGSPVGIERSVEPLAYVSFTEDVAVGKGDLLQIYARGSNNAAGGLSNVIITVSDDSTAYFILDSGGV